MPPENAVDEFANTFKEWHYLVGGASGMAIAVLVAMFALLWKYLNVLKSRASGH